MDLFDMNAYRKKPVARTKGENHPKYTTPDPLAGTVNLCPKKRYRDHANEEGVKERIKERNREKKMREYYRNYWTPEKRRAQKLKTTYGITLEDYAKMFEEQDGKCAICLQPEIAKRNGRPLPLSVDHDHVTGKVRGLLCCRCNSALSRIENVDKWFERASDYLKKYA